MRYLSIVVLYYLLVAVGGVSILTQNVDNTRAGWNSKETTLTAANVPKLRLLGTISTGIPCATQLLYYENLNLRGHTNVLFCWGNPNRNNGNMTVFAYDADTFVQIWSVYVSQAAIWATQAPAIDPTTNHIYGVLKKDGDDGLNYLIGIDILTGKMLNDSPLLINATVPGTGAASVDGVLAFANTLAPGIRKRLHSDCRASILIVNSVIYIGFGTFADSYPYHGWVFAYSYDTGKNAFVQNSYFCVTPNGEQGGIWAGSQGIASDGNFIYFNTGNGDFDPGNGSYSMAVIKMSLQLKVVDYFVPAKYQSYSQRDWDLGGCGPILLPGSHYVFVSVTKYGAAHLVDINNMGKFNASQDACHQTVSIFDGAVYPGGNPVAWNTGSSIKIYTWAPRLALVQFTFNPTTTLIQTPFVSWMESVEKGGGLAISSNGVKDPILWTWGQDGIFAFDANKDISAGPIWSSKVNGPNSWSWPIITNGKVFVNGGDAKIDVFGL